MMDAIRFTVRREANGTPVLFYVNSNPRGWWIDGYTHLGQSFQSTRAYMRSLRPDPLPSWPYWENNDAGLLVYEWQSQGPRFEVSRAVRLIAPRGLTYIGE